MNRPNPKAHGSRFYSSVLVVGTAEFVSCGHCCSTPVGNGNGIAGGLWTLEGLLRGACTLCLLAWTMESLSTFDVRLCVQKPNEF